MTSSTPEPQLRVLISGAGIAGCCLAYWLTKTKLNPQITVLERSPVPRTTGQSLDFRGAAIEIVKKMHLADEIKRRHTTEVGCKILTPSGKICAAFDAGKSMTAEYELLRADLCEMFMETTTNNPNVKYVFGDHITSIHQGEKSATVTFKHAEPQVYDLVVGADGSSSPTRRMILGDEILKDSYNFLGQYLAYFSIPKQDHDDKYWNWYNVPKGLCVMTRPHRNNTTMGAYLCLTSPARGVRFPDVEEALEAGPEAQRKVLHKYMENTGWETKRVLEAMDTADDFYMSRAAQVKLPTWHNNRGVVIGDAAHATFGVGTTLAIEGAYFLAGEISKIASAAEVPAALDAFEENFRPLYSTMEDLPPMFPQIAFPQSTWALALRNTALWFVAKTKLHHLLPSEENDKFSLPDYDWVNA